MENYEMPLVENLCSQGKRTQLSSSVEAQNTWIMLDVERCCWSRLQAEAPCSICLTNLGAGETVLWYTYTAAAFHRPNGEEDLFSLLADVIAIMVWLG